MSSFFPVSQTKDALEQGSEFTPRFDSKGLIPAIVIDAEDQQILMFAFMNAQSLKLTLETGQTHFWSRSRSEIWHKGATSGNVQEVVEIATDCDQDVLAITVRQHGDKVACHTGKRSCFYRKVDHGPKGTKLIWK